ncbi:MAG: LiaF-related protein [Gemmatimonadota bacterium]
MRAAAAAPRLGAIVRLAVVLSFAATPLHAQDWRDFASSRRRTDEQELRVKVRYGAGRIRLSPAQGSLLYRMQLRYDADHFTPVADYRRGDLEVGIDSGRGNVELKGRSQGSLDLELTREVPLALDLEMGAVRSEIELGGLRLTRLDLKTGASETTLSVSEPNPLDASTISVQVGAADFVMEDIGNLNAERVEIHAGVGDVTVDFGGQWRKDARVSVEMGLGGLELRLPPDLGVEILQDSFLTALDAEDLERRGSRYVTPGFDRAERHVRIEIEAAFGRIRVVRAH